MGKTKHLLLVGEMKDLDLFDNVPYKYIKDFINDDEEQFIVEHEHLPCELGWLCTSKFTFELSDETFEFEITYNTSSPYALMMLNYLTDDDEEEEEEDEEGEEEEDQEWHETLMAKKHFEEEEEDYN
jgi:hypothetical protein